MAISIGLGTGFFAATTGVQAFSSVEAMNRCDAFVDFALIETIDQDGKQPFKIICYFALMDPAIHQEPEAVCAAHALQYGPATRELAEFLCSGTYHTYLSETAAGQ